MSDRTFEEFVRRSTRQVADVRRPLVSAMNRKKKEDSVLRKEGNVYVLDSFVIGPSGAAAPTKWKPMERKRAKEASHVRLQQPNFLTAGGVSVEHRSKQTETVRPQFGERCEKQSECDSVLGAKSDENDVELNGETDDEDTDDGEIGFDDGSAQVRNVRDPGQPTVNEHQEHMTTHRPHRSWCTFCVMGRSVNSPHRRSDEEQVSCAGHP